jgi:hypothetical protein
MKDNDLTKKILVVLLISGGLITAGWAWDDRIDRKIEPIREELKMIREIQASQIRTEENLKSLSKIVSSCGCR